MGNISIWQLLILLLVVALVFGTKKLSTMGNDLGNAIKGFRSAMREEDDSAKKTEKPQTIEGAVETKEGSRQS